MPANFQRERYAYHFLSLAICPNSAHFYHNEHSNCKKTFREFKKEFKFNYVFQVT